MNSALMFSKASDNWSTPQDFFDALNEEFKFDLDVAASLANTKCDEYFCEGTDALKHSWSGPDWKTTCWLNPPYSRCAEFVAKAASEQRNGVTTVMLIPSRTDTRYWHEHIWDGETHQPRPGVEVRFIKGRLKFGAGKNSAPFPSVIVVFRPVNATTTA